ncbi:unnamed protein product [Tuber melanosporum]|uniref:(Perigord truffle) hypothetical protein n=1 Tax=Tuber melanosporum (strain Mel28) TaxID=656061 RepID=D5GHP3_TUBMM|nr:uncharacterized protein GSTUM_00008073001 [Tuber melanosporum]CAZ84073.1 unnamed protein product [Tuber melanosporum]
MAVPCKLVECGNIVCLSCGTGLCIRISRGTPLFSWWINKLKALLYHTGIILAMSRWGSLSLSPFEDYSRCITYHRGFWHFCLHSESHAIPSKDASTLVY